MARPNKDHLETLHEYNLHIPTRTIFLGSSISDKGEEEGVNYFMAQRFFKNLHLLEILNKDPIVVIMNTLGGDLWQGMAIYDAIKACQSHVSIKVKGNAQSMGSIILQSADERILAPHSHVMFHLGTSEARGNNIYEVINSAKYELDFGVKIDKIIFDRIKEKHDKDNKAFTKNKFNELNFKGKFMTPEETIDMGLADRIE